MAGDTRYRSLDVWRGLACLAVVFHHLEGERNVVARCLFMGVQLFFVISGYCLAASLERALAQGESPLAFARRRVVRIWPAYAASLLLIAVLRLSLPDLGASGWLSNATLTQWLWLASRAWAGHPAPTPLRNGWLLSSPHWSLNYEEQFYVVMTLALAFAPLARPRVTLALVSGACGLLGWHAPGLVTGLFVDYWLQFASGLLLHERLTRASRDQARLVDLGFTLLALLLVAHSWFRGRLMPSPGVYQFQLQLAVCAGAALVLTVLRSSDDAIMGSLVGRGLAALGRVSYSAYLVHLPLIEVLHPARRALEPRVGLLLSDAVVLVVIALVSVVFARAFERPFQRRA